MRHSLEFLNSISSQHVRIMMFKVEHIVELESLEDDEAMDLNFQVWQRSFFVSITVLDDQS